MIWYSIQLNGWPQNMSPSMTSQSVRPVGRPSYFLVSFDLNITTVRHVVALNETSWMLIRRGCLWRRARRRQPTATRLAIFGTKICSVRISSNWWSFLHEQTRFEWTWLPISSWRASEWSRVCDQNVKNHQCPSSAPLAVIYICIINKSINH